MGKAVAGGQVLLATTFSTRISTVQESITTKNQRASFKGREFACEINDIYSQSSKKLWM